MRVSTMGSAASNDKGAPPCRALPLTPTRSRLESHRPIPANNPPQPSIQLPRLHAAFSRTRHDALVLMSADAHTYVLVARMLLARTALPLAADATHHADVVRPVRDSPDTMITGSLPPDA